jgi:uncharacterized membrane protein
VKFVSEAWGNNLEAGSYVCQTCLSKVRTEHLIARLQQERGELSTIESDVARQVSEHSSTALAMERAFDQQGTLGQRVADSVAKVGGSWPFVIGFISFLCVWITINAWVLLGKAFDPYPFILLNLLLSCLAALQAPIIMMSQNRLAERDRARAENDYRVNLKAELEIVTLHEKIDHLLHSQWDELIEIQQTQLELLEELAGAHAKGG